MAQPFMWRIPAAYPEAAVGEYIAQVGQDRFKLKQARPLGKEFGRPLVRFSVSLESLRQYVCLPNSASVPLVRNEFGKLLVKLVPGDVELLPATVAANNGETDEFSYLNVISKVSAVDRNKSVVTLIPGADAIMAFDKLVCRENCMLGRSIAREVSYMSLVFLSADLVCDLKEINTEGAAFIRADQFVG